MAAGDLTVTGNTLQVVGTRNKISGTMEVDGTERAFAILPAREIMNFRIFGNDDAGAYVCRLNENTAGTATKGTVTVQSTVVAVHTANWTAEFV